MPSIYRKVRSVEKLFEQLSKDITQFQQQSKLNCLSSCGMCCLNPAIEATVLEFLPFAYYTYKQGTAFHWFDRLKDKPSINTCVMLKNLLEPSESGFCSQYVHRGLICRLFGFSANRNKYGTPLIATCALIKQEQKEKFEQAQKHIAEGGFVPIARDYYMQLSAIDFTLGTELYPINKAIARAIETVLSYYSYRERSRLKKAS